MRRPAVLVVCVCALTGCGTHSHLPAPTTSTVSSPPPTHVRKPTRPGLVSTLRLPLVRSRILPGLPPRRRPEQRPSDSCSRRPTVVWREPGSAQPDDAFFTPGYRGIITNEEFDDTLRQFSLRTHGSSGDTGTRESPGEPRATSTHPTTHIGWPTASPPWPIFGTAGSLSRSGTTARSCVCSAGVASTTHPADSRARTVTRHSPGGGILVTEIGGWVDRLDRSGRLLWSVADALHLSVRRATSSERPHPRLRVHDPWPRRRDDANRPDRLVLRRSEWQEPARPSLARDQAPQRASCSERRLAPPGRSGQPADEPHRLAIRTHRRRLCRAGLPRQARRNGLPALRAPPCTPPSSSHVGIFAARPAPASAVNITRIGSLPSPTSRLSAVALADGRVLVLGGLVAGISSSQILAGHSRAPRSHRRRFRPRRTTRPQSCQTRRGGAVRGRSVRLLACRRSCRSFDAQCPTTSLARRATLGPRSRRCPWADVSRGWLYRRPLRERSPSRRRQGPNARRCASSGRDSVRGRCGSRRSIYVAGGVTESGASDAVYRVDVRSGRVSRVSDTPSADCPCAAGRCVGCALADRW